MPINSNAPMISPAMSEPSISAMSGFM
jgi:hypothetical protein